MPLSPLLYRSLGLLAGLPGCVASVWSFTLWFQADEASWAAYLPVVIVGCTALLLLLSRRWGHVGVGALVGLVVGGAISAGMLLAFIGAIEGATS